MEMGISDCVNRIIQQLKCPIICIHRHNHHPHEWCVNVGESSVKYDHFFCVNIFFSATRDYGLSSL